MGDIENSASVKEGNTNEATNCSGSQEHMDERCRSCQNTPPTACAEPEQRRKKREGKALDSILQVLNVLQSPEEKLAALCSKYAALAEENRLLQQTVKHAQKNFSSVVKEKERFEAENAKLILAKHKLETLCRELQKSNKEIKEESLQRAREQDEKRKEVSEKFKTALNELHCAMTSGKERSTKLHEENASLAGKLQALVEQYEIKDEHSKKLLATRELEVQLLQTKLDSTAIQLQQITDIHVKEKEHLLLLLASKEQQIQALLQGEVQFKQQLAEYSEKYDEFQNSLKQSNSVFQSFKAEMDKMTKRLSKELKDKEQLKHKYDTVSTKLTALLEQKKVLEKEKASLQKNNSTMSNLCRTLHAELSKLQKVCESRDDNANGNSSRAIMENHFSRSVAGVSATKRTSSVPSSECLDSEIAQARGKSVSPSSLNFPSCLSDEVIDHENFEPPALDDTSDEQILSSSFAYENEEGAAYGIDDECSFHEAVSQCPSELNFD